MERSSTVLKEFKLEEYAVERALFEKQWNVSIELRLFLVYLQSSETKTISMVYSPSSASSSGFFYILSNLPREKKSERNTLEPSIDVCFIESSETT